MTAPFPRTTYATGQSYNRRNPEQPLTDTIAITENGTELRTYTYDLVDNPVDIHISSGGRNIAIQLTPDAALALTQTILTRLAHNKPLHTDATPTT